MTDDLDLAEISAHQFTAPMPPSDEPDVKVAGSSGKVKFRGGYTCTCVAKSLPMVETMLLINGVISSSIDIYQLGYRDDVSASAGTHSKGGCTDVGQYSDAALKVWRKYGWCMQHRTTKQGFDMDHGHGFPNGCSHLSSGAQYQQGAWNNGKNGLVSNGDITGPGPKGTDTPSWKEGVKQMERDIMAFKDDVAKQVVADLRKEYGAIADAVLTRDGKIGNTITSNKANKTLTLAGALSGLGINTADVGKQVLSRDDLIPNDDPTDPNKFMAARSALKLLLSRSRQQQARIEAILTKLEEPKA